jgi:hypothetical protein
LLRIVRAACTLVEYRTIEYSCSTGSVLYRDV